MPDSQKVKFTWNTNQLLLGAQVKDPGPQAASLVSLEENASLVLDSSPTIF